MYYGRHIALHVHCYKIKYVQEDKFPYMFRTNWIFHVLYITALKISELCEGTNVFIVMTFF